ncbi:MAG TPA: GH25 family lysozyme, partial [Thermoanaerobaculia bacterium]|nr:GH25 family lysozyme [Thermoanaerobaculia bacterium]
RGMKISNALWSVVTVAAVLSTATACDTDAPADADATAPAPATAESAAAVPPTPPLPPLRQPHEGIDVSHHSGAVDWPTVRGEGYGFAYVKASEGVDSPDPLFAQHWRDLAGSGMARGAYHFYVTEDDPEQQAKLFLDTLATVDHGDDDLLPVVDVELIGHATPADWTTNLERFIEIVEGELGVRPMVYTMPNFWDAQVGQGYGASPLWVAEYGVDAPRLPAGFDAWHLWQFDQDRDVPGVEKGADVNRVHPEHGIDHLRIGAVKAAGGVVGGGESGTAGDDG